jgi:phosphonate ABC transporter permease subunit PhnE
VVLLAILFGAGALVMLANRAGHSLRRHLSAQGLRILNLPLAVLAGALLAVGVARTIAWFYEWTDSARTLWIPGAVGGAFGLILALRAMRKDSVQLGLTVYYVTRTIFNGLRAIEPLIMAIVFVVWVGIGPFAGSLALALHTIAALAKLYSEQVESISSGPLEAVRATGANRLQNVVYAVIPQIVPPYISFTMYRWDINVRMSTIIGFVGGGGIGFLLQQNINLLNYRAAAAQILAIAIVVAAMDWLSSRIRERYV